MFGIGLYTAYGQFSIAGINGSLLVALFTRIAVGIGWYRLFDRAGKNPMYAFAPLLGPYVAFRLAWDDFSMASIFASTTFVAFVAAVGIDFPNHQRVRHHQLHHVVVPAALDVQGIQLQLLSRLHFGRHSLGGRSSDGLLAYGWCLSRCMVYRPRG